MDKNIKYYYVNMSNSTQQSLKTVSVTFAMSDDKKLYLSNVSSENKLIDVSTLQNNQVSSDITPLQIAGMLSNYKNATDDLTEFSNVLGSSSVSNNTGQLNVRPAISTRNSQASSTLRVDQSLHPAAPKLRTSNVYRLRRLTDFDSGTTTVYNLKTLVQNVRESDEKTGGYLTNLFNAVEKIPDIRNNEKIENISIPWKIIHINKFNYSILNQRDLDLDKYPRQFKYTKVKYDKNAKAKVKTLSGDEVWRIIANHHPYIPVSVGEDIKKSITNFNNAYTELTNKYKDRIKPEYKNALALLKYSINNQCDFVVDDLSSNRQQINYVYYMESYSPANYILNSSQNLLQLSFNAHCIDGLCGPTWSTTGRGGESLQSVYDFLLRITKNRLSAKIAPSRMLPAVKLTKANRGGNNLNRSSTRKIHHIQNIDYSENPIISETQISPNHSLHSSTSLVH